MAITAGQAPHTRAISLPIICVQGPCIIAVRFVHEWCRLLFNLNSSMGDKVEVMVCWMSYTPVNCGPSWNIATLSTLYQQISLF